MAWNEPGGGKDPWSGKNKDDGPPDLDEVVKKIQQGMGGIFGKRGDKDNGGSGGGGEGPAPLLIGVVVAVLLIMWLVTGFYTVAPAERGVVLRFGGYARVTMPGLNWHMPKPLERVIKVNVDQISSFSHSATMLTRDENIVDVELTVQSRIQDAEDYLFQDQAPERTLRDVTETVVREVIGKSDLDFVLTEGRAEIADAIKENVQELITNYRTGLQVTSVNMQPAKPPEAVKNAFDDAIKAREDKERLENQAEAYRNSVVPQARGEASRILADATAHKDKVIAEAQGEAERFISVLAEYQKAPEVTRERLYIDTVEEVLANSNKVLLDVESGNNLMYLPLDKILDGSSRSRTPERDAAPSAESIARQQREDRNRNRSGQPPMREVDRSRGTR
jgi:membrane protease subunit HflK